MRARTWLVVALAVLAAAVARPARADWPPAGSDLPVCTLGGAQNVRTAISDSAGGMFVAWSDARFAVTDIYVQHVGADGSLAWNPTGLIVCAASGRQDQAALARDGAGGVVIAWRDYRNGPDGDIYAQRVDSLGQTRWVTNGIAVCTASGQQQWPVLLPDSTYDDEGARGVFVAWEDDRDAPRIYIQRLASDGTPVLAPGGVTVSTNGAAQFEPSLTTDGLSGAILAWSQQSADDYDIWAQRVDSLGVGLWGDGAGERICGAVGDQFSPVALADTSLGVWIGWQDLRSGLRSVDVQHLDPAGTPVLPADGEPVCANTADQAGSAFALDGRNGLFVAWADSRAGTDVYAQRLDAAGAPLWDPAGVAVCAGSGTHAFPSIVADGSDGAIVGWEDTRNGGSDVYAQRLDASGVPVWDVGGAAVSTAAGNQYQVIVVSSGDSAAVLLWSDLRGGNVDLYAERVPLDVPVTARQAPRVLSSAPNPALGPATLSFELKARARGELTIFDAAGRRVRTVTRADFAVGDHRVAWDACDDAGRRCPRGVYFARLVLDGRVVATRTLAMAR